MKKDEKPFVEVFADGACSGNPGVGGYGIILRSGEREKELSGCESLTTNNRMELTAVIKALEALKMPCRANVVTDSNYIVKGMSLWIYAWLENNWKNSQKQEVANRDLWEKLWNLSRYHEISWQWIKGHNAHAENERCDALAKSAIRKCKGM
jgi:ribonuclease HI